MPFMLKNVQAESASHTRLLGHLHMETLLSTSSWSHQARLYKSIHSL